MRTNSLPDMATVLVSAAAWLWVLAAISWLSIGSVGMASGLVAAGLLTAAAVVASRLLLATLRDGSATEDEREAMLAIRDLPFHRASVDQADKGLTRVPARAGR